MYVSNAVSGSNITLALYNWYNDDSLTLTKITNLGVIDASTPGTKEIVFASPIALMAGRYIVVSHTNGTAPTVYGLADAINAQFSDVVTGNNIKRIPGRYQYGPPFNLTNGPTISMYEKVGTSVPNISLKRSS